MTKRIRVWQGMVIFLVAFCASVAMADAPSEEAEPSPYVKVQIYFCSWDSSFIVTADIDSLIQWRHVYLEIRERVLVAAFVEWMGINEMPENLSGKKKGEETRLAIRLTREDGTTEIFSAGPFRRWKEAPPGKGNFLYSEDSSRRKELSVAQMDYFEGLVKFYYEWVASLAK